METKTPYFESMSPKVQGVFLHSWLLARETWQGGHTSQMAKTV